MTIPASIPPAAPAPGPAAQCLGCRHWQQRGGTILPAGPRCCALDPEPWEQQTVRRSRGDLLLVTIALERAADGCCPMAEPLPAYPDAYRAQDLPRVRVRPHRGGLDESMAAVELIPATMAALRDVIDASGDPWARQLRGGARVTVQPYGFDHRTRWNTHIIQVDGRPWGFTDGPLQDQTQ